MRAAFHAARRLTTAATTCLLAAATLVAVPAAATAAPLPAQPRRLASGWLPYWALDTATATVEANHDLFSDASPFWYDLRSENSSDTVAWKDAASDPVTVVPATVARLRAAGVPVLPTVTESYNAPQMVAFLADPARVAAHVSELVGLVTANGFSGLDLDYESMNFGGTVADKQAIAAGYIGLVRQLAAALHAAGRSLTVTVGPRRSVGDPNWAVFDYAGLGAAADRIRTMTYDFHTRSGPPGPIAPPSWVRQVATFAVSSLPASKLQLGVPTYGYDWVTGTTGRCSPTSTPRNVSHTTVEMLALAASTGSTPEVDPASGESTFTYRANIGDCIATRTVWYPTASSTLTTARLVGDLKLAGLAFWTVGGADPAQWAPLRAYARTLAPRPVVATITGSGVARYGDRAVLRGALRYPDGGPVAGVPVILQAHQIGISRWQSLLTVTSDAAGRVLAYHRPVAGTDYRWYAPGTWERFSGVSPAHRVLVAFRVTLSPSVVTASLGSLQPIRGAALPTWVGRRIAVQRWVAGRGWTTVTRIAPAPDGSFVFWVRPTVVAQSWRAVAPASGRFVTGISNGVRVLASCPPVVGPGTTGPAACPL